MTIALHRPRDPLAVSHPLWTHCHAALLRAHAVATRPEPLTAATRRTLAHACAVSAAVVLAGVSLAFAGRAAVLALATGVACWVARGHVAARVLRKQAADYERRADDAAVRAGRQGAALAGHDRIVAAQHALVADLAARNELIRGYDALRRTR